MPIDRASALSFAGRVGETSVDSPPCLMLADSEERLSVCPLPQPHSLIIQRKTDDARTLCLSEPDSLSF